ncbi:hypothetical protein IGS68_16975 [Skermanella sp. TT6]|uniref:LysR substrate binding domain-containing protein n=1 Tax=Skermanella cutis TaxID=2775420 RepID=A0ABX7B0B9_9PROT|nr:hypothetical protein [Skermanella sp. TT6]QQP87775.1 hypothetical protein IGS68_16975 [Skermanella sp. TT6]
MVAPFLKRHPGIDLEIVTDTALIDIVAEGFDAVAAGSCRPERRARPAAPAALRAAPAALRAA